MTGFCNCLSGAKSAKIRFDADVTSQFTHKETLQPYLHIQRTSHQPATCSLNIHNCLHSLRAAWAGFNLRGGSNANAYSASAHRRTIRPRSSGRSDWSTAPDLTTAIAEREPIRGERHWQALFVNDVNAGAQDGGVWSVSARPTPEPSEHTESVDAVSEFWEANKPTETRDIAPGAAWGWTPQSSWTLWTRAYPNWAMSSHWETSTVREDEDEDEEDDRVCNNVQFIY